MTDELLHATVARFVDCSAPGHHRTVTGAGIHPYHRPEAAIAATVYNHDLPIRCDRHAFGASQRWPTAADASTLKVVVYVDAAGNGGARARVRIDLYDRRERHRHIRDEHAPVWCNRHTYKCSKEPPAIAG